MTDAWEMHQAETGLNPGPVWRDRGVIINTLTERNQALEERVAELEGSCQRLRDDYQGALAEKNALRARIEALVSALERTEANFRLAVNGKPVRDMAETLAENRAALASPAEDATPGPTPAGRLHRPGCVDCDNGVTEWHRSRTDKPNHLRRSTPSAESQAEDTTPTEQQAQGGER